MVAVTNKLSKISRGNAKNWSQLLRIKEPLVLSFMTFLLLWCPTLMQVEIQCRCTDSRCEAWTDQRTTSRIQASDAFVLLTENMPTECSRFKLGFCLLLKEFHTALLTLRRFRIFCVRKDVIDGGSFCQVGDIRAVRNFLLYVWPWITPWRQNGMNVYIPLGHW